MCDTQLLYHSLMCDVPAATDKNVPSAEPDNLEARLRPLPGLMERVDQGTGNA